jgi:hypothetical protein
MICKEGTVLFAGGYPDHLEEAKAYIENLNIPKDKVKILKVDGTGLIVRVKAGEEVTI